MKLQMVIKRAYEPPAQSDGQRILVERLWPRGIRKDALAADAWLREVAPSTALRKWFAHRVERWDEFQRRYRRELDDHPDAWQPIVDAARRGAVTLLYSAHDTVHNSAVVLKAYLLERGARAPARSRTALARSAPTWSRRAANSKSSARTSRSSEVGSAGARPRSPRRASARTSS